MAHHPVAGLCAAARAPKTGPDAMPDSAPPAWQGENRRIVSAASAHFWLLLSVNPSNKACQRTKCWQQYDFFIAQQVFACCLCHFCISLVFYFLFSQRAYTEQRRQRRAWLGRQNGGLSARRNFSKPHEKMVAAAKASAQRLNFASMAFGQNGFSESIRAPCFDWPLSLLLDNVCH